jgi:hypothetical protein
MAMHALPRNGVRVTTDRGRVGGQAVVGWAGCNCNTCTGWRGAALAPNDKSHACSLEFHEGTGRHSDVARPPRACTRSGFSAWALL